MSAPARIAAAFLLALPSLGIRIGTVEVETGVVNAALTVVASCSVDGAYLDFGSTTGEARTSEATVYVACSGDQPWRLSFSGGDHFDGVSRQLDDGLGHAVRYYLYRDPGMQFELGDAGSGDTYVAGGAIIGAGIGSAEPLLVYGLVPQLGSAASAGTYTDQVLLTLVF